jgi:CubicO group peptidase (beta-lactamase class C family)
MSSLGQLAFWIGVFKKMLAFTAIRSALDEAVKKNVAPGISLAFGRGNQSEFSYCCGHSTLHPQAEPLHKDALFDLASLTKVLATTLVTMRLYERGILVPDSTLGELLPGFYAADKASLSLSLLLAHCAGLPATIQLYTDYTADGARGEEAEERRRQAFARVRDVPLLYKERSQTLYSDLGPILIGELLERLCQQRLDEIFRTEVSEPLGLTDAFFVHLQSPLQQQRPTTDFVATETCAWRQRLVRGQVHDENAYLLSGVAGHAGLFATLGAVEYLAQTLLAATAGQSSFLRADTLDLFTRRQNLVADSSRALGWDTPFIGASCGHGFSPNSFGHTGFTGTSLWIDKAKKCYIVLLANRVHPNRNNRDFLRFRPQLHNQIIDALQLSPSS